MIAKIHLDEIKRMSWTYVASLYVTLNIIQAVVPNTPTHDTTQATITKYSFMYFISISRMGASTGGPSPVQKANLSYICQ